MRRHRRRTYNLLYYVRATDNLCNDFRNFVLDCARSGGRELRQNAPDGIGGRCGIVLSVRCATTGTATAEKLSDRIKGRYPGVTAEFSRDYA